MPPAFAIRTEHRTVRIDCRPLPPCFQEFPILEPPYRWDAVCRGRECGVSSSGHKLLPFDKPLVLWPRDKGLRTLRCGWSSACGGSCRGYFDKLSAGLIEELFGTFAHFLFSIVG